MNAPRVINIDEVKSIVKSFKKENNLKEDFVIEKNYIVRRNIPLDSIDTKNRFFDKKDKSLLTAELLLEKNKVVLLGDAGSGKSMELKILFNELKKSDLYVPFFVSLNRYTPEKDLKDYFPSNWNLIPEESVVIILDGLDEVPSEDLKTATKKILLHAETNPKNNFIISCRTNFYDLPVNSFNGTLAGFVSYYIQDLSGPDIINYYNKTYNVETGANFLNDIYNEQYYDLVRKPFFLKILASEHYSSKNLKIRRYELFEKFINSRIDYDREHFSTTYNIKNATSNIFDLLEKVAIHMEVLGRNYITEIDLRKIINKDFETIKYYTAFKKELGKDDIWQFEHNNIQEYLAARALIKLDIIDIKKIITLDNEHKVIAPSWLNTLSFLFSIIDVNHKIFIPLKEWIEDVDLELFVKFEAEKLPRANRANIYIDIFNHYKKYNIWIRSNKFEDNELAEFGQSDEAIRFTIAELADTSNSITIKISAVRLLGFFYYLNNEIKDEVRKSILQEIDAQIKDAQFIHYAIESLCNANLVERYTANVLMGKLFKRREQFIRAALYSMIFVSGLANEYVEYLIQGLELLKIRDTERGGINLHSESTNLNDCLGSLSTLSAIRTTIEAISSKKELYYQHDISNALSKITENAILKYNSSPELFDVFLAWYAKIVEDFGRDNIKFCIDFFEKTNTTDKAFYRIWEMFKENKRKYFALHELLTQNTVPYLFEQHKIGILTEEEINIFYNWVNEPIRDIFDKINSNSNLAISVNPTIDYEKRRKIHTQRSFDLLFDQSKFIEEHINVFNKEAVEILTLEQLYSYKIFNNESIEIDDYYPSVVIRSLKDFFNNKNSVSKNEVIEWSSKDDLVQQDMIYYIYEYLKNYQSIVVTQNQIDFIANWCTANANSADFNIKTEGQSKTINRHALFIWTFYRKFDFFLADDILLNMLSFDAMEGQDYVGIEYLTNKIKKNILEERILYNLSGAIQYEPVLLNHINYLLKHMPNDFLTHGIVFLKNDKLNIYYRSKILKLFWQNLKDVETIEQLFKEVSADFKWEIINVLKYEKSDIINNYLLELLSNKNEDSEKAAKILVGNQNIRGVEYFSNWVKETKQSNIDSSWNHAFDKFKNHKATQILLDLIYFYYENSLPTARLYDLKDVVIAALQNIAIENYDNSFYKITNDLALFVKNNNGKYKNVGYIVYSIDRIKNSFYLNKTQLFTVEDAMNRLKILYN